VAWPARTLLLLTLALSACGKEGPPLPPLVRLPAPPTAVVAERRGASVQISLVAPTANTDGTRPAEIERVDVYAITGPSNATDEQWLKLGTRVGSLAVNEPRDPDAKEPAEAKPQIGIDQGAPGSVTERLEASALTPTALQRDLPATEPPVTPLAGPPLQPLSRSYAGVGVGPRERRGPLSARVAVPLISPPPPVGSPDITYTEAAISVAWKGLPASPPIQEAATGDILPATLTAWPAISTSYSVYEIKEASEIRLTSPSIQETRFEDTRIEWGVERCYRVRAVRIYDQLTIESDASPDTCVTPADTFPPKAPTAVQAVPSDGKISLTWQRGDEPDFGGFLVLRGAQADVALKAVTADPIQEVSFVDTVAPGVRYVYAVQAVDKAGNRSEPSARSEPVEAR
jgi:hypothetical protein